MHTNLPSCFKAYDIRGIADSIFDKPFVEALATALVKVLKPGKIVIGRDARLSSPRLAEQLANNLASLGCSITDIGLCGTEEIYYCAAFKDFDLGIMITASHNPANENGFKFVGRGAIPISLETGLAKIGEAMANLPSQPGQANFRPQNLHKASYRADYIKWLLDYVKLPFKPDHTLTVLVDAGNGCAGPMLEALAPSLPIKLVKRHFEPDGAFPNGVPNPLLANMREKTGMAVVEAGADLGAAFDGDFDRCFFFDHNGQMIESCYLVGLLASELLAAHPGETIVHDTRVYWHTQTLAQQAGGKTCKSRGGHSYMKQSMRACHALYGGEMSAHHFYRDFAYCDSGMLTMLHIISLLLHSGKTLAELAQASMAKAPCSGEINFRVDNPKAIIERVWQRYLPESLATDQLDGIEMEFEQWRFNLRSSNTEPLLRLNVESKGQPELLKAKTAELIEQIGSKPI